MIIMVPKMNQNYMTVEVKSIVPSCLAFTDYNDSDAYSVKREEAELAVKNAATQEEWYFKFAEYLDLVITRAILDEFSVSVGGGCVDELVLQPCIYIVPDESSVEDCSK